VRLTARYQVPKLVCMDRRGLGLSRHAGPASRKGAA
jgi:hypothetical protein